MGERSEYSVCVCGVVVANLVPLGRVNPEPGESEKRRVVRKVVKRYVLGGLGDASDANDAE